MATPETDVKTYLRDELSRLSALMNMPITVLANPAGSMSVIGRDDVDLIFANVFYVHAEIKRDGAELDPAQEIYHRDDNGYFNVVISGRGGVKHFIDTLPQLLAEGLPGYIENFKQVYKTLNANIYQYIQDRQRRESVAAKGPRRQSADLH